MHILFAAAVDPSEVVDRANKLRKLTSKPVTGAGGKLKKHTSSNSVLVGQLATALVVYS